MRARLTQILIRALAIFAFLVRLSSTSPCAKQEMAPRASALRLVQDSAPCSRANRLHAKEAREGTKRAASLSRSLVPCSPWSTSHRVARARDCRQDCVGGSVKLVDTLKALGALATARASVCVFRSNKRAPSSPCSPDLEASERFRRGGGGPSWPPRECR